MMMEGTRVARVPASPSSVVCSEEGCIDTCVFRALGRDGAISTLMLLRALCFATFYIPIHWCVSSRERMK